MDRFQGTWSIVSLEVEGRELPDGAFGGSQIVMEGDRFTTVSMGANYGGTFRLNADSRPVTLDMLFDEGPHAGQASLAIAKIDSDRLTLCLGFAGSERPTGFTTSPGSGHALEVLERQVGPPATASGSTHAIKKTALQSEAASGSSHATKEPRRQAEGTSDSSPAPRRGARESEGTSGSAPAPRRTERQSEGTPIPDGTVQDTAEMQRLQGEWTMLCGNMDGQPMPDAFAAGGRRVVDGDRVTVRFGGDVFLDATIRIDSRTLPKAVDYTFTAGPNPGKLQLGVYELDGDLLRVCSAPPGKARPTEVSTSAGDMRTYSEWKHVNS